MRCLRRCRWGLSLLASLTLCLVLLSPWLQAANAPAPRPRLAVLIVVDQLRGDYLIRWQGLLDAQGFQRMLRDGTWFQNCHYPYAHTITGPGHASISTGCSPDRHGIVANEWFDRAERDKAYCVESDRYERVPPLPPATTADRKTSPTGVSPDRLLAPTLGDAIKEATGGKGRVVSLSFKDRSAVLLAGRRPDACYWLDGTTGTFATGTYYRGTLHSWVAELNRSPVADRWFDRPWTRLRPDLDYAAHSGPDDVGGEGKGTEQGRTFPHPMTGGLMKPGRKYYEALYNSPFGNELLLELVKRAVDAEQLGRHDVPDLLCISFSSNDPVGHCWGPDSQEVLDVTLRTDLVFKELLAHLDRTVGKDNYVLALSADHGVCPLPEVARAQGKEAGRVSSNLLGTQSETFLNETFGKTEGKARWIEATTTPWIYLHHALLRQRGLEPATVARSLAEWLQKQPGVQAAFTHAQLVQGSTSDPLLQRVQRSFHPDRCGDVYVVTKPYHFFSTQLTGTTHGSPHPYDTHVPLLVYGAGVPAQVSQEAVTPQAAAVILAHRLGISPPARAEVDVPRALQGPR